MHTVHIWFGFRLNRSSVGLIANGTVNQRPIIPERTCGRIGVLSSSFALGGFQIKVLVDVGDIKPSLNLRLLNSFKEEKMLLDAFVSIDILHRELHSFLVGVWEFAEGALRLGGGQEEQQSKRQHTHLQPV